MDELPYSSSASSAAILVLTTRTPARTTGHSKTSPTFKSQMPNIVSLVMTVYNRENYLLQAIFTLSFASQQWQRMVLVKTQSVTKVMRRHFEVCIFSYLAAELKAGDIYVKGSEAYVNVYFKAVCTPSGECCFQAARDFNL